MNRRKAMRLAAGAIIGSGIGILPFYNVFKPKYPSAKKPQKLKYNEADHNWMYEQLNPATTAKLAYKNYGNGGKLANTGGKMNCTSCHTESVGHKIFANPHYKVMNEE